MMRAFAWAVGTFALYGIGMALAAFVYLDFNVPLSTPADRIWLVIRALTAAGMVLEEADRK